MRRRIVMIVETTYGDTDLETAVTNAVGDLVGVDKVIDIEVAWSEARTCDRCGRLMKGEMSIYQRMETIGVQMDHHDRYLYVPVTHETALIVSTYRYRSNVTQFISRTDGRPWFDIPFAYSPFWEARATKVQKVPCHRGGSAHNWLQDGTCTDCTARREA